MTTPASPYEYTDLIVALRAKSAKHVEAEDDARAMANGLADKVEKQLIVATDNLELQGNVNSQMAMEIVDTRLLIRELREKIRELEAECNELVDSSGQNVGLEADTKTV